MLWLLYPRERDPVSTAQEAGWTPGLVWAGIGKPHPHQETIP